MSKTKIKENKTYSTISSGTFIVTKYIDCFNIEILFENGYKTKVTTSQIGKGIIGNPYYPKICNVGFIGEGKYNSTNSRKIYKTWSSMIERVYGKNLPTYKDVTVCEEWHNFQNFAKWFEENYNYETMKDWYLDKDLLSEKTKIYSSDTCCFLPPAINSLIGFIHSDLTIKELKNRYYIRVMVDGNRRSFGGFSTKEEAFERYLTERKLQASIILDKYKQYLSKVILKKLNSLADNIDKKVHIKIIKDNL